MVKLHIHARRKIESAQENNPTLAGDALKMFQALYDIEREIREENPKPDAIRAPGKITARSRQD